MRHLEVRCPPPKTVVVSFAFNSVVLDVVTINNFIPVEMISRAPTIGLYRYLLRNKSERCQKISYQVAVLIITFFTYTAYHMAKRPFSVVKGELGPNCTVTEFNNTCFPWKPFNNPGNNNDLFGLLDFAFLAAYALTMFISGYVAEHTNLRLYLSIGMISTGALTAVFGSAYYFHVHSLYFFFLLQVLTGITQSSGNLDVFD